MKTERVVKVVVFAVFLMFMLSGFTQAATTIKTLATGAPVHGSNGIYIGPDQNIYIASGAGSEIIKMDPNTGGILARIGSECGVLWPDDVTFGPDGSLYWTGIMSGDIGKILPNGVCLPSIANMGGPGGNPITVAPDNSWVYAGNFYFGQGLYKLRPDGSELTEILPGVNINGFDFGPDGWLYMPFYDLTMAELPKIIKVNVAKTTPLDPATDIEDVTFLTASSAVKFDSQGRLVTNNLLTKKIFRKNLATGELDVLATVDFNVDNIAIDSQDQIYVSSDQTGVIVKIKSCGGGYDVISPGGMIMPSGVAVLPHFLGESVYVGDMWGIHEFDGKTGKELSTDLFNPIMMTMPFNSLTAYAFSVSADGSNLLIASPTRNVIQEYCPKCKKVLANHSDPIKEGVSFMPINAIRYNGSITATDAVTGLVVKLMTSGGWQPIAFTEGGHAPVGLATDGNSLWVTDNLQGKVYDITGASPVVVACDLSGPEGLAYYPPTKSLLVVESKAGRLTKIDLKTGAKTVIAQGLNLGFDMKIDQLMSLACDPVIDGVAVGSSNTIYVTGNKTNVLYRINL